MSNFVSLNTALTGLRAAQLGMDVASHNIANANTLGYTRQRVDLAARQPFLSPVGPVGTGVDVAGINRIRDGFLDARVRHGNAMLGALSTRSELLRRTEAVLGEPDNGLTGQLTALWAAFEDLAMEPGSAAARQQVVASLDSLTGRVRAVAVGWDALERDTVTRTEASLVAANDLLGRLAEINRTLPASTVGAATPNDLLDERDALLDQLSTLVGVTIETRTDGTVAVSLDGALLVDGGTANRLAVDGDRLAVVTRDEPSTPVLDADGDPLTARAAGEIGALFSFVHVDLPAQRAALDALVDDLVTALNTQHALGQTADGSPGGPLLTYDGAPSARTLGVPAALRADPGLLAPGLSSGPQDGRNADALADLRSRPLAHGKTLDRRLTAFVVGLAGTVASALRAADAQSSLSLAASMARSSVHGVSLDEEMVAVIQFQRTLEATSRVMTAVDQALDTLITRTGIVGR